MIGNRRNQGTLQRPPAGQDAQGEPSGAWSVVATVFADIRYQRGLAALRGNADVSLVGVSINIGWREDVLPGWRFVYGSTVFQIAAVLPDSRRKFVDLVCTVVQ